MSTKLVSGDALVTAEYWDITGNAGEGTLMTFSPDPRANPEAAPLVKKFKAAGIEPEGYVLYSYAALQVFEQAAKQAGTNDPAKVLKVMKKGKFDTVIGSLSFDRKGDVSLQEFRVHLSLDYLLKDLQMKGKQIQKDQPNVVAIKA